MGEEVQKALDDAVRVVGEAAAKARPHVEEVITNVKETASHVEDWVKDEENIEAVKNNAKAAAQEVGDRLTLWCMIMKRPTNVDVDCQFREGESWTHRWSTHDGCSWNHYGSFHGRSRIAGLYPSRHRRQ